jgi:hypothetical protein
MFNQLRMNLRRPLTIFSERFANDSRALLDGYGKPTENIEHLLSSSHFISDEDQLADFHLTLATT